MINFLYAPDIKSLPPPKWIFKELLQENSTALLYGPSGLGKSFVALEMVCAAATQHSGIFNPLAEGAIIYVTPEGAAYLNIRLRAWELDRGVEVPQNNPVFVTQAVQIADPKSRREFVEAIRKEFNDRRVLLIIFDTLAKCAVGLDENSAKDMGLLVHGLELIREEFSCTLILVHHSTKANPKMERGSGAVFGAVDTVLSLLRDGVHLKLECPKQKNGERTSTRRLNLKVCHESCVLDAKTVAKERIQLGQLQSLHVDDDAKPLHISKAMYMRDAFPPRTWDWNGESPVCAVTSVASRVIVEQIDPDDADFQKWLEAPKRLRQISKDDKAAVNPFLYTCEDQEWWDADPHQRHKILEARRAVREDRLAGRGDPTALDLELAWWIWGICDMGISQADVIRWLGVTRGQLQRAVKCWKDFGLLPFKTNGA